MALQAGGAGSPGLVPRGAFATLCAQFSDAQRVFPVPAVATAAAAIAIATAAAGEAIALVLLLLKGLYL